MNTGHPCKWAVVRFTEYYGVRRLAVFVAALLISAVGLLTAFPAQASTPAVGTIPGSFGVTPTGAAAYFIPISVPHGAGGLTPSIGLVYNSQSGEGAAGYGWTLSGLSAITRCPLTIDDDGETEAVELNTGNQGDDFCLDGQRLRDANGGVYGAGGTTYDTELRSYSLITSETDSSATSGPSWFTVQTKDGTTYKYGNTTDSKIYATGTTIVRVWALDKVTDANGNYYTISYQNNDTTTGDYWPLTISYTGNTAASTSPLHTITFNWTPRSDATVHTTFLHGTLVTQTQLLSTITVSYNGATTFTYTLSYQTDLANFRNQLDQVQECAPNTSGSCFAPTTIVWQSGAAGWTSDVSTGIAVADQAHAQSAHLVDVNGDGIMDLLYPEGGTTGHWVVLFGQPGGGFASTPVDTGIPVGNYQWALVTDANGDGRMDLLVPGASSWTLWEATGNTSGTIFNEVANGLGSLGTATNSQTNEPDYEGNVAMVDYAGRGLGDFLYSNGVNLYLVPNNGPTSNPQFGSQQNMGAFGTLSNGIISRQNIFVDAPMDFDGSGRMGRLGLNVLTFTKPCIPADQPGCIPGSTTRYTWSALAASSSGYQSIGNVQCWTVTMAPAPMDATGGGLTDLLYSCPATNVFDIELSTGTGFIQVPTTIPYSSNDPLLADYYGDGRQEAVVLNGSGWSMIRVNYDPPTASFVPVVTATDAPYPGAYVVGSLHVGSIEANGLDDLVYAMDDGGTYHWHYNLHAEPIGRIADVVTEIQDGLGNAYSPTYALLTNTPAYTEGSGAIYPLQDVKAPLGVVTSYQASNGIGGTYTESYTYSGAEMEVEGRGFLGFGSRSGGDSRSGVTVTDAYNQTFPWIGSLLEETLAQSNGLSLSDTVNTFASSPASCSGGGLCFAYLSQSIGKGYDVTSGALIRKVVTQNNAFDDYGDVTNQTVTTTDKTTGQTFSAQSVTAYTTPGTAYCIASDTVTVTRSNSSGSLARETDSSNGFDSTHCRPTDTVVEASNAQPITTAYGYDPWGNVSSVTVSGTGLSTNRITTTDYSTYDGEYPNKITNALGQSITESWNPALGTQTSMTDANGHITTFGYDDFGRRTSETRADGTVTNWTEPVSTGGGGCPSGVECYAVSASETAGGSTIPLGTKIFDADGRAIRVKTTLLGGAVTNVSTNYDALGRVVAVSKPFLSGADDQYWTDRSYDVLNRPIQITAPASASVPSGDTTKISYIGFTTTSSVTAPPNTSGISNETAVTTTDALGEVTSKTDGSGTAAATTSYTYDPFGDLVSTIDADNHTTSMTYDGLGHKTAMTDPNLDTWTYSDDALGEVLTQTDAKGQKITQVYDVLGRLTARTEFNAGGTQTVADTWQYDTATDGIGLLASERDSNGFSKSYTYDNLSRPSEVDTTIPGTTTPYAVDTSYDSFGRVSTVTYPASVSPSVPVASAVAAPTSATVGGSITLNGSGSTDPNGLTLSYLWSGPSGASINNPFVKITSVTTSTPGNYTFQLVVSDANASSTPATVTVSFTPRAPGAPTISQSPPDSGSYTVSWSPVSGATFYDLYESTDGGTTFNELGSVSGTSDALSGRTTGTYYYEVATCENSVCGNLSAPSSAVTVILPPSAPQNLSAAPNPSTTGSFTLTWSAVTGATSYAIYQTGNSTALGTSSSPSFTLAGSGSPSYYVTACNSAGCSAASATVSETVTLPPGTPGTPLTSPNPSTNGNFTVSWSAPSGTTSSVTLYESTDQVNWTTEASSGTSWSASGFGNGTYYFKVTYCVGTACTSSGVGSETVTLTPAAPTGLSASPNPSSNGSYTLSWTAPSGLVTGYDVYGSGGSLAAITTGSTSTSFSGIADGSYTYDVEACNQAACSSASTPVTETVLHIPGVPPSVTTSPTSSNVGSSFTLSWGTSSGTVSYYTINGGSTHYSASTHSATLNTPVKDGTYSYYVQACNATGCSADSASATETATGTIGGGGGGGCPPKPYQCQVMTVPGSTSKVTPPATPPPPSPGGTGSGGLGMASPSAPRDISPVLWNSGSLLATLAQERQLFAARPLPQPSEAVMQAQATQREQALLPSLLPSPIGDFQGSSASVNDVTAWNTWDAQWKQTHPKGPDFAPPEYIAWADAKLEPASGSTYRFEVQYNYDPASGALQSVSNAQTGFVYWQAATGSGTAPVDAFGHLLAYTDGNNVSTVMAYDQATGAPVGISTGIGQSSSVQSLIYVWDGYGNLEERGDGNRTLTEIFDYDDLNRLTNSNVTNPAANGPSLGFSYDAMGNIQTRTLNGVISTYSYDPNHPYAVDTVTNGTTTVYSASYDANGNMITRNGYPLTWTVDNLPDSLAAATGSSTFSYGPEHDRYQQSETYNSVSSTTTYIGSLFEVIATATDTLYRHNIVADGQVIAVHTIDQSGSATTSYLHYDHLGSVDTLTNDQGTVAQSMSFDAFGLRRDATNWNYDLTSTQIAALKNDTDRGYTYQEQLDNVGLIHMNGRVYDPGIGRFISADPTMGGDRYAYANDNPLEFADPSGYCSISIAGFSIGGGEDCTEQAVSDTPGLSTAVNALGDLGSTVGQELSHIGLVAQDHINQIIAVVVAYYTGDWVADGGTWGAGAYAAAGATYGGTDTALNGGNGTQVLEAAAIDGLEGYEIGGAIQGYETALSNAEANYWNLFSNAPINIDAVPNPWAIAGQEAAFDIGNVVAQQEVDRYASDHGMNPVELDAELFAFSFIGNELVGSRYTTNFEDTGQVGIEGYFDNQGGALAGAPGYVRDPLEFIFDSTDALLALQGIPTASAINLIESGYTEDIYGESLGSWDVDNLEGYGYVGSSSLYALPFGKVAAPGVTAFCQYDDPICGGAASLLLNPEINLSWGQGGIHAYCTYPGNGPC